MTSTILWRNLTLVSEARDIHDHEGQGEQTTQTATSVFIYMLRGAVIEVSPATGVRLTDDCLEVVNEKRVVAAYPRERVLMASTHLVEAVPA